jgi:hypothetical protein
LVDLSVGVKVADLADLSAALSAVLMVAAKVVDWVAWKERVMVASMAVEKAQLKAV